MLVTCVNNSSATQREEGYGSSVLSCCFSTASSLERDTGFGIIDAVEVGGVFQAIR